ncbi:hypothetical protein ACE193_08440 [Bernardetia sp. OM2101]|uniref:hypothetical protein n=1 Tax=Bernardetia sp. OM2101 TaxID=3344876 RepID=UPI0035D10C64
MPKNLTLSRFLFSLIVNGFTLYGVFFFDWNFFTVVYLFWVEEIIRLIFKFVGNILEYKNNIISKREFKLEKKAVLRMGVLMSIYFVCIFLFLGYFRQVNNHIWKDNLDVILFQDMHFNFNILLMIVSEIILFSYLLKNVNTLKEKGEKADKEELLNGFFRKEEKKEIDMNDSEKVIDEYYFPHFSVSTVFFLLFTFLGIGFYYVGKGRFNLHTGETEEFVYMLVFTIIQIVGEVWSFLWHRKNSL